MEVFLFIVFCMAFYGGMYSVHSISSLWSAWRESRKNEENLNKKYEDLRNEIKTDK